jgi:hypothetical protein
LSSVATSNALGASDLRAVGQGEIFHARRLARLGGSDPEAGAPSRRRMDRDGSRTSARDRFFAMAIAEEFGIYAYDAYILDCALRHRTALLSLDARQCEVAWQMGIEVIEVPE